MYLNFSQSHSPFPVEDIQHYNQPSHYQQDSNGQSDDQMDEVFIRYCRDKGNDKISLGVQAGHFLFALFCFSCKYEKKIPENSFTAYCKLGILKVNSIR